MSFAIWTTGLSYCIESYVNDEVGNGRIATLVFDSESDAEDFAFILARTTCDEAYFVTDYPCRNPIEWRAEWWAARDRVRTLRQ